MAQQAHAKPPIRQGANGHRSKARTVTPATPGPSRRPDRCVTPAPPGPSRRPDRCVTPAPPAQSRPTLATRTAPTLAICQTRGLAPRGAKHANATIVELRYESRARRREIKDLRHVKNAAAHIRRMPAPGCSIHGLLRANWPYSHMVPAVLKLIAPATLSYVAVTTLGFSRRVANLFVDLLDRRQIATCDFLVAKFFEHADAEICDFLRGALTARGSRFAAARCHAKVLLLETTAGDKYVSESSANIRACNAIEQFALTNDPQLFAFHRAWIDDVVGKYKKPKSKEQP